MSLAPGTRLGSYDVLSLIGVGGMGEVYRARDARLHRDVAVKILPQAFARDADRRARFEREARILASLNHPGIAAIYGIEEGHGTHALVLEFVDGLTLDERLARGPIPWADARPIARQIADALEAAHDLGVVHRDLKPSNIKLKPDGTVKVLDFGLAMSLEIAPGADVSSLEATATAPALTVAGAILGTAAYMSPEQARGQTADRRSDVWAFGCVLYEMLAGRRAFDAGSMQETMAAVLRGEPDWQALPPGLPAGVRMLLERCLEKDRHQRLRDVGDARLAIDDAERLPASPSPSFTRERRRWRTAVVGTSIAALAAVAALVARLPLERTAPAAAEIRFDIATPPTVDIEDLLSMALSPDGRTLAYVAPLDGRPHVWLRSLASVEPWPLPGTEDAFRPFWSADGASLAFFTDEGRLKRIDLDGGLVRTLTAVAPGVVATGSWSADGTVLFAPNPSSPILRLPADGGTPEPVTRLEANHTGHLFPHFLPDGRRFLFFVAGGPEARGIYVGSLDASPPRRLADSESGAHYTSGHLVFARRGAVFAWPFDVERLSLTGAPVAIADGALTLDLSGVAEGTMAFRVGSPRAVATQQFAWVDRTGQATPVGASDATLPLSPSLSPDGTSLAFLRRVESNADIWLLEVRRGVLTRLTDHVADDLFPVWFRDGAHVAFTSNRDGEFGVYRRAVIGDGVEEKIVGGPLEVFANDLSAGDEYLLFARRNAATQSDLWALPLRGGAEIPIAVTGADERDGQFSPDGQWVAYGSNRSGRFEVYVQRFMGSAPAVPVSDGGGAQVRWGPDGRELFYIALNGVLTRVPLQVAADGRSVVPGAASRLFQTNVGRVLRGNPGAQYVVSGDGQRFLMNTLVSDGPSTAIRVIRHWRRAP